MYCMKCGKEIKDSQVFCDDCRLVMQRYPIKPGTAAHLPNRPAPQKVASRRKAPTPEEQIHRLHKIIRRLTVTVMLLAAGFCLTVALLVHTLENQAQQENLGKNYSTIAPTDGT